MCACTCVWERNACVEWGKDKYCFEHIEYVKIYSLKYIERRGGGAKRFTDSVEEDSDVQKWIKKGERKDNEKQTGRYKEKENATDIDREIVQQMERGMDIETGESDR